MTFAYCRAHPCLGEIVMRIGWWKRLLWRITGERPICKPCRKAMRKARV